MTIVLLAVHVLMNVLLEQSLKEISILSILICVLNVEHVQMFVHLKQSTLVKQLSIENYGRHTYVCRFFCILC